jgi:hypothetical protein
MVDLAFFLAADGRGTGGKRPLSLFAVMPLIPAVVKASREWVGRR